MFTHHDLEMFGLKLKKLVIFNDLKLWVVVVRHNFPVDKNLNNLI